MDTSHAAIVPGFEFALTVLSTVISRHGSTVVLDTGKKTIGLEHPPPLPLNHPGRIQSVAEEHTVFELDKTRSLRVGYHVELVPGYCPVTVNLHDTPHRSFLGSKMCRFA
jgi:D-serine deaminase-like pyridoxal phosphate-dependent protein